MKALSRVMAFRLCCPAFVGPVAAVLAASLLILAIYLSGPVNGKINNLFLPARMFGIPSELQARGIEPLYLLRNETGWDGQFYYSIANDPFAQKDTPKFIDAAPYRYQRVGLPLLANIVSKATLQDWVSPLTYYVTELLLLLLAVGAGAVFFRQQGLSPYLMLLWALGAGTQMTMLNFLPDGTADALLILALLSLQRGSWPLYVCAMTFAALSREIYALVPCFMGLGWLIKDLRAEGWKGFWTWRGVTRYVGAVWFHAIPAALVLSWHVFLRLRFGVTPSSEADGILGFPLRSHFEHMISGLTGHHWLVGTGSAARYEGVGIILFLVLVGLSLVGLWSLMRKAAAPKSVARKDYFSYSFALGFFAIVLAYLCFGKTVMMHFTGYFKAANIFLFLIPFLYALQHKALPRRLVITLLAIFLFFGYGLWNRIAAAPYYGSYLTPPTPVAYAEEQPACLKAPQTKVEPLAIQDLSVNRGLRRFSNRRMMVVHVRLTNLSKESLLPYKGDGATMLAARWINAAGKVELEGLRTEIDVLKPGASVEADILVPLVKKAGRYTLRLSPMQEGCGWFDAIDPANAFEIPYQVR